MTKPVSKLEWRLAVEQQLALICKYCLKKVIDPDKRTYKQVFTKSKCPHCYTSKDTAKAQNKC